MVAFKNVQEYGAVGDGITDDGVAIVNARNALIAEHGGGQLLFPETGGSFKYAITFPIAFDERITLGMHDGVSIGGSGQITLYDSSKLKVFLENPSFTDTVVLLFTRPSVAHPEWFGAVGDGSTDDYDAVYAAILSIVSGGGVLELREGATYRIGTSFGTPINIAFRGRGVLRPEPLVTITSLSADLSVNHNIYDTSGGGSFVLTPKVETRWLAEEFQEVFSVANTVAVDALDGHNVYHLLTENTVIGPPSNIVYGATLTFLFRQLAGNSFTVGFNTIYKLNAGAFTMTPAGGTDARDQITFKYNDDLGFYFEVGRAQNM